MNLRNLYICLTPLQVLIAEYLIRQNNQASDVLLICYQEADNEKFRYYFQKIKPLCEYAEYIIVPNGRWQREWAIRKITQNIQNQYHTVFVASIDNPNVQFALSKIDFDFLETFDDGTANLYPSSILYHNPQLSLKRKIINYLQGVRYQTEDLKQRSRLHHTLYPNQNNIISHTQAINLWYNYLSQYNTQSIDKIDSKMNSKTILLGQPLFSQAKENIELFEKIIRQWNIEYYFPHPREDYQIPNIDYIDSHLIFEDFLLNNMQTHPQTEFKIYHIASTAAFNIHRFPNVQVYAIRPQTDFFKQASFEYLYDLMHQMNIPIIKLNY